MFLYIYNAPWTLCALPVSTFAISVGETAPDFTLLDYQDKSFTLSEQKGKIVLLFFMGYDCGSCIVEAPDVEKYIHKELNQYGIQVVGVDLWDGTSSIVNTRFVLRTGISFPILTYGSPVARLYGMTVSNYVIIGLDGKINYISYHYDRQDILQNLDSLTSTPGQRPKFVPSVFRLEQNFPNPFNPGTRIDYEIKVQQATAVELIVYNILGEKVLTLVDATQKSGFYEITWDGRTDTGDFAPAGIYFYKLFAGDQVESKKMMLLK